MQGACIAAAGEVISTCVVRGLPLSVERAQFFALWGLFVAFEARLWLRLLDRLELAPAPMLDSVLKSFVNQLSILPLLTAVFLVAASAFLHGTSLAELRDWPTLTAIVADGFSRRYSYAASFWLSSDLILFTSVPTDRRVLWVLSASAVWSVMSSWLLP